MWGSDLHQFPHPGAAALTLLLFLWLLHPTEFCVVLYIPSSGRVLLSALSWCSARTSVSEGGFLMYPWTETYSTSTYSSAIFN